MKKLLMSAALIGAFAFGAKAQDAATGGTGPASGNIYVTGLVNFETATGKDGNGDKTFTGSGFGINLMPGYMLSDKLGAHLIVGFESGSDDSAPDTDGGKNGSSDFNIGAGAKYYMGNGSFFFAPSLDFVYGSGTTKSEIANGTGGFDYEKTGTSSTIAVGITPRFAYFLGDNVAIDFGLGFLGYTSTTFKDGDGDKTGSGSGFGLDLDILNTASIGFTYWIK